MAKIPGSINVKNAIRALSREVEQVVREVNQQAAKFLGRGEYDGAESLIAVAKSVDQFGEEVKNLHSRWNEIRGARKGAKGQKAATTPMWEYYQPLLKVLVDLGGEASRKQIEGRLESQIDGMLKEGDYATNVRGMPKWKVMVGRARKHLIEEGFLSDENLLKWTITKKGEHAAKAGTAR